MSQQIQKISAALFDKIRSRFETLRLGDTSAQDTSDPNQARVFNFDYVSALNNENFGNITLSLLDEKRLKVYYSKNISDNLDEAQEKEWFEFLHSLRQFARRNKLRFDTHDISRKRLRTRDIQQMTKNNNTVDTSDIKLSESRMYGSPKTSFENIGTSRIRIVHTESINPDVQGSRARHINAIYVENAQGERFRLQHNRLSAARAQARHISEGGNPYDDFGQHINQLVQEMSELSGFVRGMRKRVFEDQVTMTMVEAAVAHYNTMHDQLNMIRGVKSYHTYKQAYQPHTEQLDEADINDLKERFVKKTFDDRITAALPHVHKAYQMQEQYKQKQVQAVNDIVLGQCQLTLTVNEGMDTYMQLLRFSDTNSMVKAVLEDIAARAATMPEVAAFARHWANNYTTITEDDHNSANKALAVQLATQYMRDLAQLPHNSDLRTQSLSIAPSAHTMQDLAEGTWAVPETAEQMKQLSVLLSQPLAFGMDGTNVTSALYDVIGDDDLYDKLSELSDDMGAAADAVPAIKQWLQDNMPGIYEKLSLGDQSADAAAASGTMPAAQTPIATDTPQPPDAQVVSEELLQMLRIAGLRR